MDPSLFYAITGAGITAVLLVFQLSRRVHRFLQDSVLIFLFRHVVYPLCINRHTLVGPWSRGVVLLQAFYWAATLFCSCFQIQSLPEAATRTGILSLINLVPLYLGFQLSFVADILGVSLRLWRHLHGTLGVIAVVLALVHVSISLATDRGILQGRKGLYTILAGSSLLTVVVLSIRILRHPSYEIFLRLHQALAFLSLYAIWRHIHSQKMLPRLYITIAVGSFLITSVVQWIMILYRNFSFRDGCCRALITRRNGAVRINIRLPRPLYLRAGQYINIWIPSISFWSFLQSHPFTIVSWTDGQPMFVDLLVEPKSGFTNRLMQYARDSSLEAPSVEDYSASDFRIVWFSGPHGSSTNVGEFGSVLLVATDFGIAAQLPVLKELISGFNRCEVRTRRIHLVWQLRAWGDLERVQDLLNKALEADVDDNGYIFRISMYFETGHQAIGDKYRSNHNRLAFYDGVVNIRDVVESQIYPDREAAQEFLSPDSLKYKRGRVLVAVSASQTVRDNVREVVLQHVEKDVRFLELEYQPVATSRFCARQ